MRRRLLLCLIAISTIFFVSMVCIAQLGERAANCALQLDGVTYFYGAKGYEDNRYLDAASVEQIDCSGLVVWAYNTARGPTILSNGAPIITTNPSISQNAAMILRNDINLLSENEPSENDLEPGDLLFLKNTYTSTNGIDHVGIYVGNSNVIHAKGPNFDGRVDIEALNDWLDLTFEQTDTGLTYKYRDNFAGYGRIRDSFREGLNQFTLSESVIASGEEIDDRNVEFKAKLSNPDGKRVRLQVELRRLNEYGGRFVDSCDKDLEKDYKNSELVTSGQEATSYAYDLIDGNYHWRARAVSEDGTSGDWVNFGCDIHEADFIVSASSSVVGEWTLHSRRASNFIPTDSTIIFYPNHIFFDSLYGRGTWSQSGNTIHWEYDLCPEEISTRFKTAYDGTIDLGMAGTMQSCDGEEGDWSADRRYTEPGIMA